MKRFIEDKASGISRVCNEESNRRRTILHGRVVDEIILGRAIQRVVNRSGGLRTIIVCGSIKIRYGPKLSMFGVFAR